MTRRLELLKCWFHRWNREDVGNIFRKLEVMKAAISALWDKEDQEGDLNEEDLADIQGLSSSHHSLLQQ